MIGAPSRAPTVGESLHDGGTLEGETIGTESLPTRLVCGSRSVFRSYILLPGCRDDVLVLRLLIGGAATRCDLLPRQATILRGKGIHRLDQLIDL